MRYSTRSHVMTMMYARKYILCAYVRRPKSVLLDALLNFSRGSRLRKSTGADHGRDTSLSSRQKRRATTVAVTYVVERLWQTGRRPTRFGARRFIFIFFFLLSYPCSRLFVCLLFFFYFIILFFTHWEPLPPDGPGSYRTGFHARVNVAYIIHTSHGDNNNNKKKNRYA